MGEFREIRSGQMSAVRMRAWVADVCQFFNQRQIADLKAMYGWGCDLSIDEMWQSIPLKLADVPSFMEDSTVRGIFTYGKSDLFLADDAEHFEFCFCHEGDLHFKTDDITVLNEVADIWVAQGLKVYGINKIDPAKLRDNSA